MNYSKSVISTEGEAEVEKPAVKKARPQISQMKTDQFYFYPFLL